MPDEKHGTTQRFKVVAEHSYVKVGTLVTIVLFMVGGAWNIATWKQSVESHIDDRWRANDMRYWCIETEAINEDFKCGSTAPAAIRRFDYGGRYGD